MDKVEILALKSIYPVECVIKAAAKFLNLGYFYIGEDDKNWIVYITAKASNDIEIIKCEFNNELLAQAVRICVYKNTKNIREMLLARAISTSLINNEPIANCNNKVSQGITEEELEEILTDWFNNDVKKI